jgi:hypothetical protein
MHRFVEATPLSCHEFSPFREIVRSEDNQSFVRVKGGGRSDPKCSTGTSLQTVQHFVSLKSQFPPALQGVDPEAYRERENISATEQSTARNMSLSSYVDSLFDAQVPSSRRGDSCDHQEWQSFIESWEASQCVRPFA